MTIDGTVELDFDAVSGPLEAQRDLPLTFRWRTDRKGDSCSWSGARAHQSSRRCAQRRPDRGQARIRTE